MWLRRELGDDLLAQEVLAETFAAAWLASGRFRDQGEGAAPWLHGIARNLVRRLRRDGAIETRARQRLGLPTLEPDNFEPVIERLSAGQEFETFSEEFARLPSPSWTSGLFVGPGGVSVGRRRRLLSRPP